MEAKATLTMSVPDYGSSRFNMSKNAAYAAAHRGELPVIQIGARLYVPVKKADRQFGFGGQDEAA